jgi:nucleoside 2-deoxyribosyltransferase
MPMLVSYNAGPDVFFPDPVAHAARKAAICARHGIVGRSPIEGGIDPSAPDASRLIYEANRSLMLSADIIIANLTPFRGPSADDGTAFEVGFFDALGRPAFAYSNAAGGLAGRTRRFLDVPDNADPFAIEDFGLPCNLMLPHAVLGRGGMPMFVPADGRDRPFDDLETFERLVAAIARHDAEGLIHRRAPTP